MRSCGLLMSGMASTLFRGIIESPGYDSVAKEVLSVRDTKIYRQITVYGQEDEVNLTVVGRCSVVYSLAAEQACKCRTTTGGMLRQYRNTSYTLQGENLIGYK